MRRGRGEDSTLNVLHKMKPNLDLMLSLLFSLKQRKAAE